MQKFFEFMEAREKTVVFTFGRFNPPTTGHEKLIKKVADIAAKYSADFLYILHIHNLLKKIHFLMQKKLHT